MDSMKKVEEITHKLEEGISNLFNSEKYSEYLRVMSRFHSYSFNNTLLIAMQMPDATYVAGYSSWKDKFQRNVNKGEQGIRILAPSPYKKKIEEAIKDPQTNEPVIGDNGKPLKQTVEVIVPSYKVVSVFDISQTSGKELPSIVKKLEGDIPEFDLLKNALSKVSPVNIFFSDIKSGANGYYHLEDKEIHIKDGMSQQQTIKTMIHEISHSLLHDKETGIEKDCLPDNRTKEVEAESIAYVVCNHFGLDTSDYSFGYVAGWSSNRNMEELKKSMNTIRDTSNRLINEIEKAMLLEKEKGVVLKFYFSECGEFHSMGDYQEFNSLKDAMEYYKNFNRGISYDGGKEIGFIYYDKYNRLYNNTEMSLVSGNRINTEMINEIEVFRNCTKIQDALEKVKSEFSNTMKENMLTKTSLRTR